jgi:transposase
MSNLITFGAVAQRLAVHKGTVSRWATLGIRAGREQRIRLPYVRVAGRCYTTNASLHQFLDRCRSARFSGLRDEVAERAEELLRQRISEEPPT